MEPLDVIMRLVTATIIGGLIGLNRDLHGKPTGVRTLGLVCLGSAILIMAANNFESTEEGDWNAMSRVIQGLVTGIGFLGGGVIIRDSTEGHHIRGLTTAACIWLTACLGIVCAVGAWLPLLVGLVLIFLLLVLGGPLEKAVHRWHKNEPPSATS
jgi:putative Mg2+ transporter-C (MgtC) family protein